MEQQKGKKLSLKQRRFVEAYAGEAAGNATQAAKLAGYSLRTARSQGQRLLTNADILKAIDERAAHTKTANGEAMLSPEECHRQLHRIATDTEQKTSDRLRALELAMKSQGMFSERHIEAKKEPQAKIVIMLPDNGKRKTRNPGQEYVDSQGRPCAPPSN